MEVRHSIGSIYIEFMRLAIVVNIIMASIETIYEFKYKFLKWRYENALKKLNEDKEILIKCEIHRAGFKED